MAKFDTSKISQNDINAIMSVLKLIFGKVKERGDLIKNQSIPIMIMCGIIAAATIGTLIYFILYHYIGPLMIVCAVCIIILSYGLGRSSKNFQNLMDEFEEYDTSVDNLMNELVKASLTASEDYTANALAIALSAELGKTPEELQQMTYADLVACPKYEMARKVVSNLASMRDLVNVMSKEKLDVDKLISQYDSSADLTEDCEDAVGAVTDVFQKNQIEPEENSTVASVNSSDDYIDNVSTEQHDSNGRTMYVEDTSIVV